jgi:hypothetical protein
MTELTKIDLKKALPADALDHAEKTARDEIAKRDGKWAKLLKNLSSDAIMKEVMKELDKNSPVSIFATGWARAGEMRAFRNTEKYPPGTTSTVKMGKFQHKVELNPKISLSTLGLKLDQPLTFGVLLDGLFEAVELSVTDGHIDGISGGNCNLSVDLKLQNVSLLKQKPKVISYTLPASQSFAKPGIRIP